MNDPCAFRMYYLSGRMVAQERLNSPAGQFVADVALPPGMYILQVELESGAVEGYKVQVVK